MSEFSYLTDRLASQQIAERVASAEPIRPKQRRRAVDEG